jgi:MFS family permease
MGTNPGDRHQKGVGRFIGAARAFATPEMLMVLAVAFTFGLTQTMYRPLVAPYAIALGADAFLAGTVVAVHSVPGLLLAVPGGSLVDRFGTSNILIACGFAFVLGGVVIGALGTLAALFAAMVISGIGTLGIALAGQGLATNPVGDSGLDTRRVAGYGSAILVGHLVGPTLGGVLSDAGGYRAAFWAICGLGVLLIASTTINRGKVGSAPTSKDTGGEPAAPDGQEPGAYGRARRLLGEPGLRAAVGLSALGIVLINMRVAFLPLYLDGIGWSASAIGLLLSGASLAALLTRPAFPAIERAVELHRLLRVCLVAGAVMVATAVATADATLIAVATVSSGVLLGAVNPSTLTMLARTVADGQRGVAIGLRVTANRAAQTVGPVAFGALSAATGVRAAFFAVTGVAAAASGVATRARRRPR